MLRQNANDHQHHDYMINYQSIVEQSIADCIRHNFPTVPHKASLTRSLQLYDRTILLRNYTTGMLFFISRSNYFSIEYSKRARSGK